MAEETYLDSSIVGFNHQDALDARIDTYSRLGPILNAKDNPAFGPELANNLSQVAFAPSEKIQGAAKIDLGEALVSDDPIIKANALKTLENERKSTLAGKFNLGKTVETPRSEVTDKFMGKKFGFSAFRDDEDFYYKNVYEQENPFAQKLLYNPARFVGRVLVPAVLKLGEGLGYIGSMIGSVGSDNYWADVADNGMSRWLEGIEQDFKDQVIPVYKQAGFDEKGFFSKLIDWSFWNESVADGVAFMASAFAPGMAFSKLGSLGKFGQAFSTMGRAGSIGSKIGAGAAKIGLGSGAEIATWTFNTAMEAAVEGAGVFKEMKRRLEEERAQGLNDLTDEEIRTRAGQLAGNTVGGNFAVLGLSNAWENTMFFKVLKGVQGRAALQLADDFKVGSRAIDNLQKGAFASGLGRARFYGGKATQGFIAEGLWEENAQLAIQRMNQEEAHGRTGIRGFFTQLGSQTYEAFLGKSTKESRETAESIGLGTLIGIGAGVGFSKASNERKKIIAATKLGIVEGNELRQRMFDVNDIYERGEDNKIVFDDKNQPKVDVKKMAEKAKIVEQEFGKISLTNLDEYHSNQSIQFMAKQGLANYVRSMKNLGIEGIGDRLRNISPENATLFGMDPRDIKSQASDFADLADTFEEISKKTDNLRVGKRPEGVTQDDFGKVALKRKANIYSHLTNNTILEGFVTNLNSELLTSLNDFRKLSNSSLSQYPVDQLNTLLLQKKSNDATLSDEKLKSTLSEPEIEYYEKTSKDLQAKIDQFKIDNEISLKDSRTTPNGYYVVTKTNPDGSVVDVSFDKVSVKKQEKLAQYTNSISYNTWMANFLSDEENGHANYMRLIGKEEVEDTEETGKSTLPVNTSKKWREKQKGDFAKVTQLVAKLAFQENPVLSAEETSLQTSYSELILEMIDEYNNVVEEQSVNVLNDKISVLQNAIARLDEFLSRPVNQDRIDANTELQILFEELSHPANQKRADQKRIKKAIEDLSEKIKKYDDKILEEQSNLDEKKVELQELIDEATNNNYKNLYDAVNELKEQVDWNQALLDEQKGILEQLKQLLRKLVATAGRIFGKGWRDNLKVAYSNGIEYFTAIDQNKTDQQIAQETIAQLEETVASLQELHKKNKSLLNEFDAAITKFYVDKYLDTTKAKPEKSNPDDDAINKNLEKDKGAFPGGVNGGSDGPNENAGFDGNTYQRPLDTKFFTSTFPDYRTIPLSAQPQTVQDYFKFVEFLTNSANGAAIKAKLPKKEDNDNGIFALIVTKNNVKQLGLEEALSDRTEFFAVEDPALTHVEIIPVIKEAGIMYYVDAELNKIGTVNGSTGTKDLTLQEQSMIAFILDLTNKAGLAGWTGKKEDISDLLDLDVDKVTLKQIQAKAREMAGATSKAPKNFVRTVLRRAVFTQDEQDQYSVKYTEADMNKAIKAGTDWRTDILKATEENPIQTFEFDITRGIPNRMKMQDGTQATNPVVGTLIPEVQVKKGEIPPLSIRVYASDTENATATINDIGITVPSGRPFIYTTNGIHEQLHPANNSKLTAEQVTTVNRVFDEMLKDHLAKVMDRVNTDTSKEMVAFKAKIDKVGGIDKLTKSDKRKLFLHLTNTPNGYKLFNSNYTNYISSVLQFGFLKKGKTPGKNQIYFKGHELHFGDKGWIDLTDPTSLQTPEVQEFIADQFHNIKYLNNKIKDKYIEYYIDKDNKLVSRQWANYATYLLSDKLPDGTTRTTIPVTTSVKTKVQHDAEAGTEPYYPYLSRGITIATKAQPVIKKNVNVETGEEVDEDEEETKKTSKTGEKEIFDPEEILAAKKEGRKPKPTGVTKTKKIVDPFELLEAKRAGKSVVVTTESTDEAPKTGTTGKRKTPEEVLAAKQSAASGKTAKSTGTTETPPEPSDPVTEPGEDLPVFDDMDDRSSFRIATRGLFQVEKDMDAVVADIQRMLPQFPVVRLKKAIQVTPSIQAWGQFVDDTIRLFEMGEEGTGYHEAFEAVVNKILSDAEWRAIYKEFTNRKGTFRDRESGETIRYLDANPHQAKEELAEEFMRYKQGKPIAQTPQTKSFFKIIWDFIKAMFGGRNTIEDTFAKIDAGKFRERGIRIENRFVNNYRLDGLRVEVKHDLYQAATSSFFKRMFYTPESLTVLDDFEETDETLYENVKAEFNAEIRKFKAKLTGYRTSSGKVVPAEKDLRLVESMKATIKNLEYTIEHWGEFVEGHKEDIKHLNMKFEEREKDDKLNEDDSASNRNDYTQADFTTDGKKSASKSIKFLVTSLLQVETDKANGGVSIANEDTMAAKTNWKPSTVNMPKLVDYDKVMLQILEEFQNLNDFDRIEKKLKDLSGITKIEEQQTASAQTEFVKSMTDEQAMWTVLYRRLFGNNVDVSEEAAWNLKVKFNNYVSKHSPEPFILINGGSTTTIISAIKRPAYEFINRKIENSIRTNANLVFDRKTQKGSKIPMFVPNKALKKVLGFDEFTELKKGEDIPSRVLAIIKFLGLTEELSPQLINDLTRGERTRLYRKLFDVRTGLQKIEPTEQLNLRTANIFNYTTELIFFLDTKLELSQKGTQHLGINNEMRQNHTNPSFVSKLLAEISNVSNIDELRESYPHLFAQFAKSSIIMDRLFDEDGNKTGETISLGYMSGIKDLDEQEGTTTSKLEFVDRYWQQFNASLQGLYYTLPADGETEAIFNFGEFVPFQEDLLAERGGDIINEIFIPKLKAEIDTARTNSSRLQQLNITHKSLGRTAGNSLRFFKDILASDPELLREIHQMIDANIPSEQILSGKKIDIKRSNRVKKAIKNYLDNEVNNAIGILASERLLLRDSVEADENPLEVDKNGKLVDNEVSFKVKGLNNNFINKHTNSFALHNGEVRMNERQMRSLVEYQKLNTVIANMEAFQIVFGDPAQYKDWDKRAKSMLGPVEQTFMDSSGKFNPWLQENKNSAEVNGESVVIPEDDMFHYTYRNHITSRTVADIKVVETDTVNDLQSLIDENPNTDVAKLVSRYIGEYEKADEADGQSIGSLQFARHLMIKSGWRWTKSHENFFQYDQALMRLELSALPADHKHKYTYSSKELQDIDIKIWQDYQDNPDKYNNGVLSPVKTLMPYVTEKGEHGLLKHSIHFMSYNVAKEFELLDLYIDMLKRKEDIFNFSSVQKIGVELDNNNQVTPYYSDPFTKNDLVAAGNPTQQIPMSMIGIQVETQSTSKGQTLGTQTSKDINLNLFEGGVPTDFKWNDENLSENKAIWDSFSHEEKLEASENYAKVYGPTGTFTTLQNLKMKNTLDTFDKIGIKWNYSTENGFSYEIGDLTKIKQYIHNELRRLEVDENTVDNIELTEDLRAFKNAAETTPSYTVISNLLWSMADKAVTSMKVNGKPLIQVSSAFFNKESRKAAYKDPETKKWVTLNSKEEYDAAVAAGHKPVMTSSELKFYTRNGPNGETTGMEVYLPHIYKKKVNDKRKVLGLKELNDQELMGHLNKNPKLLEGVGFRIPTQATSSIDFFVIKGFMNEAFGNAIVVPSAVTVKGGSDFDVDKLSTYLNNWRLGRDGLPYYEAFSNNNDIRSTDIRQRYINYIQSAGSKDVKKYVRTLAAPDKNELKEEIDALKQEIRDVVTSEKRELYESNYRKFRDELSDINQSIDVQTDSFMSELFSSGRNLFFSLPDEILDGYFEVKRSLRERDVNGPLEIFEYLEHTELLIESNSPIVKDNKEILKLMSRVYNQELDLFQWSRESREKHLTDLKEQFKKANLDVKEYYKNRYTSAFNEEGVPEIMDAGMLQINFDIATEVAKIEDLKDFTEFSQLPLHLQNTKGAVENQYFESIRNVLKSPDMFAYLLSPNSVKHIKKMKAYVYRAQGVEGYTDLTNEQIEQGVSPEENRELNYTNYLSTEYIARKRNDFAKGKSDIAIFAIGMTNLANSQVSGISINGLGGVKENEEFVFHKLNNSEVGLPFTDVQMQMEEVEVEGQMIRVPTISISALKDKNGDITMDKISAYLSGAVDVAKGADIVEMGMHTEVAGVYILLEKMGLTGETIALFMKQPSIREYLKELLFLDFRTYFGTARFNFPKEIITEYLSPKYLPKDFEYNPKYRFNDAQLAAIIGKETKGQALNNEEKMVQWYALITYLKLKMYSNHLLESIQASNHDTSSIRSPYIIIKKDLQLERAETGNMVTKIEKGELKRGGQILRDTTAVSTDVTMLKAFGNLFSRIQLFALQRDNPHATLFAVAGRIYRENPYMNDTQFIAAMREYESAMIDSLTNKVMIQGNVIDKQTGISETVYTELYKYARQYFETGSKVGLKARHEALKQKYPGLFGLKKAQGVVGNFFLENLTVETDENLGIDLIHLNVKYNNSDVLTKEKITRGLRQLATYNKTNEAYDDLAEFYKAIVYGAYLQFGIKYSRDSFVSLIPVNIEQDDYYRPTLTDLTTAGLRNIDNEDFRTLDEQVQRSKSSKKGIVPEKKMMSVLFLEDHQTEKGKFYLNEQAVWRTGKSKPPARMSQTFFGKVIPITVETENGITQDIDVITRINPMMIWGGYEGSETGWDQMSNIIKVPAVKPEYLIAYTTSNEGSEYSRVTMGVSPVVFQMMKQGNYSFMFEQLYKKVGVHDSALGRQFTSAANKSKKSAAFGKKSVYYLYKPINSYSARGYSAEMPELKISAAGEISGPKSILKHPRFTELADAEIVHNTDSKNLMPIPVELSPIVSDSLVPIKRENKGGAPVNRTEVKLIPNTAESLNTNLHLLGVRKLLLPDSVINAPLVLGNQLLGLRSMVQDTVDNLQKIAEQDYSKFVSESDDKMLKGLKEKAEALRRWNKLLSGASTRTEKTIKNFAKAHNELAAIYVQVINPYLEQMVPGATFEFRQLPNVNENLIKPDDTPPIDPCG